jgi:Domain of Unknown Function (DUF928)
MFHQNQIYHITLNLLVGLTIISPSLAVEKMNFYRLNTRAISSCLTILCNGMGMKNIPTIEQNLFSRPLAQVPNWKSANNPTLLSEIVAVSEYEPPPVGRPDSTDDAGTRGPVLAIVPGNKDKYGLTAAEYPSFWVLVNNSFSLPKTIKLELLEDGKNIVYQTTFELIPGERIMNIRLAKTAPPLKIGKKYLWIISYIGMNNEMHSGGWISRVELEPELEHQLKQATARERLLLFAKKRLWYETVTELVQLIRANPQDTELNHAWSALLQRQNLTR